MINKMSKNKVLATLIQDGRFAVADKGGDLWIGKVIGGRSIFVVLEPIEGGGRYIIRPPKYNFHSPASHFDYTEEEERITRNKHVLFKLIKCLKETKVWEVVDNNRGFFTINAHNKKMNSSKVILDKVQKEFDEIR
jgi:hypothetical protein